MDLKIEDITTVYDNIERINWIVFRNIDYLDKYYKNKEESLKENAIVGLKWAKEELSIKESIEELLEYGSNAGIKIKNDYINKEYSKVNYQGIKSEKLGISENIGKILFDSMIRTHLQGLDGLCKYIESKFNGIGINDYSLINEAYENICMKYEENKTSELSGNMRKINKKPSIDELNAFLESNKANDAIKEKVLKNFGF